MKIGYRVTIDEFRGVLAEESCSAHPCAATVHVGSRSYSRVVMQPCYSRSHGNKMVVHWTRNS